MGLRRIVAALSFSLVGCSLIIDVPADCEDVACAPYVCDSSNVACEESCAVDTDCVPGFVCSAAGAECVAAGCEPIGDAVLLQETPSEIDDFAVAIGGNAEQIVVALAQQSGLGLLRFVDTGARIQDVVDPTLGAVRLAPANDDLTPFEPIATAREIDGVWTIDFSWRANAAGRDQAVIASFDPAGTDPPAVILAHRANERTLVDEQHVLRVGTNRIALWRQTVGQGALVLSGVVTPNQVVVERDVSPNNTSALSLDAAAVAELGLAVTPIVIDGRERLDILIVDELGAPVGTARLQPEMPEQQVTISHVEVESDGVSRWAAVWSSETDGTEFRALTLSAEEAQALRGAEGTVLASVAVGRDYEDVDGVDIALWNDQLFVAWEGRRLEQSDVWIARYRNDGQPRFAPFSAVGERGVAVDGIELLSSERGVDLVWRERSDAGDALYLRRYACLP
ncbi:MAG: hypothetical protein ACI81R_000541 [Bradymonadia bacterium]